MNDFELTLQGIIRALSVDGCNSKQTVKKALEQAKIKDLYILKRSIEEEIRMKEVLNGDFDESN